LFTDRSLFARMWRAALLQFMAQMCGATAMKYYLPALFKALGFNHRVSLLAGGIESTLKTGCTVIEMFIIDRAGRRLTLLVGAIVMAFALMVRTAPIISTFGRAPAHALFLRSTAPCHWFTQTTSTEQPITPALCLSLFTHLATAWALVPPPGFMVPRYGGSPHGRTIRTVTYAHC
jgi:hypothetical protein